MSTGAPGRPVAAVRAAATGRPAPRRDGPRLPRGARRTLNCVHAVISTAWLGAHAAVVVLLAIGLAADTPERAGTGYGAAEMLMTGFTRPAGFAALATGLLLAVTTPWGLFRHYWVFGKLLLTAALVVGGNLSLTPAVRAMAAATEGGTVLPPSDERLALLVPLCVSLGFLVAATVLSLLKPFGRVRWRQPG
ncbi:hypothetical protein [Marinactinospora rubrisoli]|uniref:DUF2269 domain-containing protein n=1 Tax=Marinactinospora rubrisoli TaxID=2715399 RepID=A0ABW2KLC9_9ACTN